MFSIQTKRSLYIRKDSGETSALSAASALVCSGTDMYVIADDQSYLARFASTGDEPGEILVLFEEEWPNTPKARKARKADLEALVEFPPSTVFPQGALVAFGSGSRSNRQRGIILSATKDGPFENVRHIDLAPLFEPLRGQLPQLNIEGATICGDRFVLLHRGNKGDRRNAAIIFPLQEISAALARGIVNVPAAAVILYDLGEVEDVPLCFTDGVGLSENLFVFSAVAEDTIDNYQDGLCVGSAIGIADLNGRVLRMEHLPEAFKIEGIALDGQADVKRDLRLLLVSDADAPEIPARLLRAEMSID